MSLASSALPRTAGWAATVLSLCAGMHGAQAAETLRYRVQAIPELPGATYTLATDLNDRGMVTGHAETADGNRGFLYRNGRLTPLGLLDGRDSYGEAINNRGDVVGAASDANGLSQPVLFRNGRVIDLRPGLGVGGTLAGGFAIGINSAGVITGEYAGQGAFIHDGTHGQFLNLDGSHSGRGVDINNAGTVLVDKDLENGLRPGLYRDGTVTWLPALHENANVSAGAINNAGDVVGTESFDGYSRVLLYSHGAVQAIEPIYAGGSLSSYDINERGWIVGELDQPIGGGTFQGNAYLYRDGTVHNLNDLLTPAARSDWHLIFATGINERGQVVGVGFTNGRAVGFIATPVPETASVTLMLAGLMTVAFAARAGRRTER